MIDPTEYLLDTLMGTGINRATAEQLLAEHDTVKGAALLRQTADDLAVRLAVGTSPAIGKGVVLRFLHHRAAEIREQANPTGVTDGGDR